MMARYRNRYRPVAIDAVRWDGTNWGEVCDFLDVPRNGHGDVETLRADPDRMPVVVSTPVGDMRAELGDYIIRTANGVFYPHTAAIFALLYDPIEEER